PRAAPPEAAPAAPWAACRTSTSRAGPCSRREKSPAQPSAQAVNSFHVLGGLLALWALLVSFLGITRENFPASKATERAVAAISVVLVAGAIVSAAITGANEREEREHESREHSALVPPF
ncbi:MAG: hypothetical protein M3131_00825, partial [Actinomycetota bacterium]|nr:hypothetical protein [Actinomycetota bacterium]